MANLTNAGENKLCDHLAGKAAFPVHSSLYLGLLQNGDADYGDGTIETTQTEMSSSTNYERVQLTGSLFGTSASSGAITNDADITFPTATSDWSGGGSNTVTGAAVYTASTSGTCLYWFKFASTYDIEDGDTFKIASSALTITSA